MQTTRWHVTPYPEAQAPRFAAELGVSPLIAALLIIRGYDNAESAHRFLNPDLSQLHDPFLFPGMDRAVDRLRRAVESGERIVIYGDYDVDGVTATALLVRALRALQAKVESYIPHRLKEGYGLNAEAVREIAAQGPGLLITVDCGISAREEIALARAHGLEVIVSDHHEPPEILPEALAILNPKIPGSSYPFHELAGVGVAFKLLTALVRRMMPERETNLQKAFIDLVALGTIADVAPLVDENRVFARLGLDRMRNTQTVGLRALMQLTGIGGQQITGHEVGFVLGPRLNAGGRLDTARDALQLLLTKDENEALTLASRLDRINRERQEVERAMVNQAIGKVSFDYDFGDRAIVLSSEEWHPGVVGIAASRMVEKYHRPTILLAIVGEVARGSGRSISAFDLRAALEECRDLLGTFGGHKMAAGLSLASDRVDEFRKRFCEVAASRLSPEDLVGAMHIDAEISGGEIAESFINELEMFAPFGQENPRPQFALRNAVMAGAHALSDGAHLKLRVKCAERFYDALWWRHGDRLDDMRSASRADLCVIPEFNEFNGIKSIQFLVRDVQVR